MPSISPTSSHSLPSPPTPTLLASPSTPCPLLHLVHLPTTRSAPSRRPRPRRPCVSINITPLNERQITDSARPLFPTVLHSLSHVRALPRSRDAHGRRHGRSSFSPSYRFHFFHLLQLHPWPPPAVRFDRTSTWVGILAFSVYRWSSSILSIAAATARRSPVFECPPTPDLTELALSGPTANHVVLLKWLKLRFTPKAGGGRGPWPWPSVLTAPSSLCTDFDLSSAPISTLDTDDPSPPPFPPSTRRRQHPPLRPPSVDNRLASPLSV